MYTISGNPLSNVGTMPWLHAFFPLLVLLVLWSLFWKALALWHAARRGQSLWFFIFLILNTAGILEIIYLFLVAKLRVSELFSKKITQP